jgi:CRISPR-associated protein Csb1
MPNEQLTFSELLDACSGSKAAIRTKILLQPVAGPDAKVFPATHLKGVYAEEFRNVSDGAGGFRKSKAVLIDSVQSQANRLEQVLLDAVTSREISLPMFSLQVDGHTVTSLDAPHRVYDAFFWDATLNGQNFRESDIGRSLVNAWPKSAHAMFKYAPTALLFGAWDSRAGGLRGARFPRAIESEIVALDAEIGVRTQSRMCPIGIKGVRAYAAAGGYTLHENEAERDSKNKPIQVEITAKGHSNIPPTITEGGVTATKILQTALISLTQLRQLRFGDEPASNPAFATLAAIGLFALARQCESGYALRSRCHLIPVEEPVFELIGNQAGQVREVKITATQAKQHLSDAIGAAQSAGLAWNTETISLKPMDRLTELVRMSEHATAAEGEEASDED